MKYLCKHCNNTYDSSQLIWQCKCKHSLWLDYKVEFHKSDIVKNDLSMWRYDKAYPIKKGELSATFNEGLTPLARINFMDRNLLVKMDSLMPTGSFKDRGVIMVINYLKKMGVKIITEDSSGNAGASNAAYAALADIKCNIYVPKGTSSGKLAQTKLYGANIFEIDGSRDDVATAAQNSINGSCYAGHNWHPMFVQGTKSVAYEIWEQNNFNAPDNIVCSVGNGSTLIGMYLGFYELLCSGEIKKMPRLFGVQAENCNTIYRAFNNLPLNYKTSPTIAEGIALYRPSKVDEVVKMVKYTKGLMLSVTEGEIISALKTISHKGFYIEPTSAAGFAGMIKLIDENIIKKNEITAITVSGTGLKATDKILKVIN